MDVKLFSVIIPTRNEERNIERCLCSIVTNGYSNVEIIVVDQESTDSTCSIAKKYNATVINVPKTSIYQPPAKSRNIGYKVSKGDYIYHIDADMELEQGLLQELAELFENPAISAIIVPEKDVPTNIWAKAKAFERSFLDEVGSEAARVSRRDVFDKTGYDESISSGEDWSIHEQYSRLGEIARSQKMALHYTGSTSPLKEFKKKFSYGKASGAYVQTRKGGLVHMALKMAKVYIRKVTSEIFKHPVVVICFIILRGVDMIGLMLGLIISKFRSS